MAQEKAIWEQNAANRIFRRIDLIVQTLRGKYPIKGIDMGMGTWNVISDYYPFQDEDGSGLDEDGVSYAEIRGWQGRRELDDWIFYKCPKNRWTKPKDFTVQDEKLMLELADCLNFLIEEGLVGSKKFSWK